MLNRKQKKVFAVVGIVVIMALMASVIAPILMTVLAA